MDSIVRLKLLSEQMSLESAEECNKTGIRTLENSDNCPDAVFIHPAILPNGQKIKLLKTLLTSVCERDCHYCPFRSGRDFRRATFQPEEFARLFITLIQKGIAEGIFLSSGVTGGGIRTQDKLLETAEILRLKFRFNGYIHLKIMPGAEFSQVERAMHLSNRVSVNLEAPNADRLTHLAPRKQFQDELLQPLKWMEAIRQTQPAYHGWQGHWPSSVTQFVAGGAGESDLELLSTTQYLTNHMGLKRAYYSRFTPIPDTPLENQPPTPPIREQRLYQASYLLRDYGFDVEELLFDADGILPVQRDPKLAWAQQNLAQQPIEINCADRATLIRVPGIGLKGAEAILKVRRHGKIRDPSSLTKIGVLTEKAVPFLLFDGRPAPYQPSLF